MASQPKERLTAPDLTPHPVVMPAGGLDQFEALEAATLPEGEAPIVIGMTVEKDRHVEVRFRVFSRVLLQSCVQDTGGTLPCLCSDSPLIVLDAEPGNEDDGRGFAIKLNLSVFPGSVAVKASRRIEGQKDAWPPTGCFIPVPAAQVVRDGHNPFLGSALEGLTNVSVFRTQATEELEGYGDVMPPDLLDVSRGLCERSPARGRFSQRGRLGAGVRQRSMETLVVGA
jgi:hypothetical protein